MESYCLYPSEVLSFPFNIMLWRFMLVHMRLCAQLLSRVQLLWPHGLEPTSLLCPWDLPGKNTGVGCHFLFQGIFLTQGSNPSLLCPLHRQADSLPMSHLVKPVGVHNPSEFIFTPV